VDIYTQVDNWWVSVADSNNHTTLEFTTNWIFVILWTAAHAKLNCVHLLKDIPNPCAKSVIFLLYRFQFEKIACPCPGWCKFFVEAVEHCMGRNYPCMHTQVFSFAWEERSSWPKNNQITLPSSFCLKKRSKGNLDFVHSFELRIFLKSWDLKHYCDCNNRSFTVHIDLQQWAHTPGLNFVESQLSGSVSLSLGRNSDKQAKKQGVKL
jgi:hypothetical protein